MTIQILLYPPICKLSSITESRLEFQMFLFETNGGNEEMMNCEIFRKHFIFLPDRFRMNRP